MENLHLLYNKSFYDKLTIKEKENEKTKKREYIFEIEDIKEKCARLTGCTFNPKTDYKQSELATDTFLMKTSYPGLLVGSGYAHGVSVENDAKIGFYFDYTTGQPCIPGSSVKGTLKSFFEKDKDVFNAVADTELDEKQIETLKKDIFESNKDVFFDAVIKNGDKNGKILAFDFITPHPGPTKDPNPIQFLKILPDVVFEFRFALSDSELMKKDKKKELFIKILELFGAGAKTNVGYGTLEHIDG